MKLILVAESELLIGNEFVLEGLSPNQPFFAVFEDDGDTGYFYANTFDIENNIKILDALHIYDVAQVIDKSIPSLVQIVWSYDGLKTMLLINKYPHAIIDFINQRAYCRTGFPPPIGDWIKDTHDWDEAALELFN